MLRKYLYIIFIIFISIPGLGSSWVFRPVGIEFEYAASPDHPFTPISDGYIKLLEIVKTEFHGGAISLRPWNRYLDALDTVYGVYTDDQGREWKAVPEMMSENAFDGFELVTPPLTSSYEVLKLAYLIKKIKDSGIFITGNYSSTHFTADVSDLVDMPFDANNDEVPENSNSILMQANIARFVDLILFIENHIIEIYHLIQPNRYGSVMNTFAIPLSFNQRDLLNELAALPRHLRTYKNVRNVFLKYQDYEFQLTGGEQTENRWKMRAFNYAKFLELGDFNLALILEMRLSDLVDSDQLLLREKLFKALIAVGINEQDSKFNDPFRRISPGSNLSQVSKFIRENLDLNSYSILLRKLELDSTDFPPFTVPNVGLEMDSPKSCVAFLNGSYLNP